MLNGQHQSGALPNLAGSVGHAAEQKTWRAPIIWTIAQRLPGSTHADKQVVSYIASSFMPRSSAMASAIATLAGGRAIQ